MAEPAAPEPVKYFVAVLFADAVILPEVCVKLTARFGAIDFEGRSIREIAEQLRRSEGAVKQLQFRALQTLRAQLEGAHA